MIKLRNFLIKLFLVALAIVLLIAMASVFINYNVKQNTEDDIAYKVIGEVEIDATTRQELIEFEADCVLVLGAGIKDANTPSPMLRDRLDVGIELYKQGIAPKLLLTGDNGQLEHNEIHVMLNYVKDAGVPEEDIFCDHAGFSTYDSMYRASSIFDVQKAIVVTQEYHQYRALYIGKKLGLEVKGVSSDQKYYSGQAYRDFREFLARNKDFIKAFVKADPELGGEKIPISGSGVISHGE